MAFLRKQWKTRSETEKTVIALFIVVLVTLGAYVGFTLVMATSTPLVVVTSNSMVPSLQPGDLLVLQGRSAEQIQVGDIVVYNASWYLEAPVVHRVVAIDIIDEEYHFFTCGDANGSNDPGYRTIDDIIGVMVLRIPLVGNVSIFLRSPPGWITIILIFAAIIILPELYERNSSEQDTSEAKSSPETQDDP
ncbi:MAG: signal peptidase I [Candidatus Thorarchaeota archaeon]|nr:signal peptidase I [Candidatus Thorarchaeota archaeon]